MTNFIFNQSEVLMAIGTLAELQRAARGNKLRLLNAGLAACCLILLGVIDWEVYFRIFQFMTDNGEDFWSPHLMACTPAIMLIGFHVLASQSSKHPVVRLVGFLAGFFIVAFIVGGGLYIAAMLYQDAGAPGQQALSLPPLGALPPVGESGAGQSWLDALFANVTSPAGVLAISLGIGGLSVVSVYAGHRLIVVIEHNVREAYLTRRNLREGLKYHRASQEAEARFAALAAEHERLMRCSDDQLLVQIAGLTLQTINTHIIPHEKRLQRMRFENVETRIDHDPAAEIKCVESAVKKIRELTLKDVLNALSFSDKVRGLK